MTDTGDNPHHLLSRAEARRRTSAGIFYVASSGFASLLIGFAGNLVLARLLTPRDFGLVAFGSTITLLGGALAEGGLGSGMIRRSEPPSRADLRALNGIQLSIALGVCIPSVLVALQFGLGGAVTAVMILSLPIETLQTPGRVVLAREMKFHRQAVVNVGALAASQAFSITAVAFGAGVWGLAAGAVVKAAAGTVLIGAMSIGLHLPSFRGWRRLGPVMRFGFTFQSNWIVIVIKDQGLNVIVAAVGGVGVLGLWSLAGKILQVPLLLLSSLSAVAFPAVANLLARGEDPNPIIMRTVRMTSVASTLIFVPFAAASVELIPLVFGDRWRHAADVIPLVMLGQLILGPVSVGAVSYLFALGRPGAVIRASVAGGIAGIPVTSALLPFIGITAVGVGTLCASIAEAVVLARETHRAANIALFRPILRPVSVALLTGSAGLAIGRLGQRDLWVMLAASGVGLGSTFAFLWLFCRRDLLAAMTLCARSIRDALPGLGIASAGEG